MSWSSYHYMGSEIPGEGAGKQESKEGTSDFVLQQLRSRNPGVVLLGIGNVLRGARYPREEVCEELVGMIRKGTGGTVAEKAAEGLLAALETVDAKYAAAVVRQNLFVVNDLNGRVLAGIAAEGKLSGKEELQAAALEMLGRFSEGEIGMDTLRDIEQALRNAKETASPRIQKKVEDLFGVRRGRRPKLEEPVRPNTVLFRREMTTLPAAPVVPVQSGHTLKPAKR